jgi:hypothetical protein
MIRILLAFVAFLIAMCLFAAWLRYACTQKEKDGYPKAAGGKLPPIPRMAAADAARVGGVASAPRQARESSRVPLSLPEVAHQQAAQRRRLAEKARRAVARRSEDSLDGPEAA